MVGNVNDGTTEMIAWNAATDSYTTIDIQVGHNTSIAYSTDGELYAVTSADETGEGFATYVVDTQTGSATAINSTESAIEEPISDISRGPIM
jgi:Tol biopolymer transport system component